MAKLEINLDGSDWVAVARVIKALAVTVTLNDEVIEGPFTDEAIRTLELRSMITLAPFIEIDIADSAKTATENPLDQMLALVGFDVSGAGDDLSVIETEAHELVKDGVPASAFPEPDVRFETSEQSLRRCMEHMMAYADAQDEAYITAEALGEDPEQLF